MASVCFVWGGTATAQTSFEIVGRFPAPEAHQGVAVDAKHFYAIANQAVTKYDKKTGGFIKAWRSNSTLALKHLNSGVVVGKKLFVAHSNWPTTPTKNSLEIWETETLTHVGRHSFQEDQLAVTWADHHDGAWWVVFAAYGTEESVQRTELVKFDMNWQAIGRWRFPTTVIDRFLPYSNSGGSIGADGLIYATGHDRSEVYVLDLPDAGTNGTQGKETRLRLIRTLPLGVLGQAIAWDRSEPTMLYGIRRKDKVVVAAKMTN